MVEREIYSKTIFSTKFTWQDAVDSMKPAVAKMFDGLPDPLKEEIINTHNRILEKGMEGGLMTDWNVVMDTALDNVDLFETLKGKKVLLPDPQNDEEWQKSFIGEVIEVEIPKDYYEDEVMIHVKDQDSNIYVAAASRVKFVDEEGNEITDAQDIKTYEVTLSPVITIQAKSKGEITPELLGDIIAGMIWRAEVVPQIKEI